MEYVATLGHIPTELCLLQMMHCKLSTPVLPTAPQVSPLSGAAHFCSRPLASDILV